VTRRSFCHQHGLSLETLDIVELALSSLARWFWAG